MFGNKQNQEAGNNSTQIQAKELTINYGITEERAREIYNEQNLIAHKEYTKEAFRIADMRARKLEEKIMAIIQQDKTILPAFADPEFQIFLRKSLLAATTTEREADYDLLTELLVRKVQNGEDRIKRAVINRAVEIVGGIDNDALCGLTVMYALLFFFPPTDDYIEGIEIQNKLFEKLIYQKLPLERNWIEHLEIFGAVRIDSFQPTSKFDEFISYKYDGYICTGIKENSKEYNIALQLLQESQLPSSILKKHEYLEGYYRLVTQNGEVNSIIQLYQLNNQQIKALKQIRKMYSEESSLKQKVKDHYMRIWNSNKILEYLNFWWNSFPIEFEITNVGMIIAQANAKRCDPSFPEISM